MLRVGEGSSGGGEKKERRERSDDQLRRYASKILEVSMKYGLSQEDEAYLYQMLDMAYGVKFEGSGGNELHGSGEDDNEATRSVLGGGEVESDETHEPIRQ